EVSSMALCKLTGQPALDGLAPDLAITDLVVTPDRGSPRAACGSVPGSDGPAASPTPAADSGG
ncbi:MAG TPA: hypothetical protein VIT43_13245, partial [Candidatus Dormibacteraeota bacterium]